MSTQYTVRQMIDLAVGTPDGGSINLSMLQAVLHVLAHAQRVSARPVQLREVTAHPPRAPTTLVVSEKRIRDRQQSDVVKYIEQEELAREKFLREIRQREDSMEEPAATPTIMCSPVSIHLSHSSVRSAPEYIIVAERVMTSHGPIKGAQKPHEEVKKRQHSGSPSKVHRQHSASLSKVHRQHSASLSKVHLQQAVSDKAIELEKNSKAKSTHSEVLSAGQIQGMISENAQCIELASLESNISALEVSDAGVDGIANAVNVDKVYLKNGNYKSANAHSVTETTFPGFLSNMEIAHNWQKGIASNDWNQFKKALDQLNQSLETLNNSFLQIPSEIRDGGILMDIIKLREKLSGIVLSHGTVRNLERKVDDLHTSVSHYTSQIAGLDTAFNDQIVQVEDEITELKEEVEAISKTIHQGFSKLSPAQLAEMAELQEKLDSLQSEYDDTSGHVVKLLTSNEENERFIQDFLLSDLFHKLLLHRVEYLNVAKSDNEQLVDALVNKADRGSLNEMMTEDQFQASYSALLKIVNEIQDGFNKQVAECSGIITELREELDIRATRDDLTSLDKLWIRRFTELKSQLKQLQLLSEDIHASGTKQKYIRNVDCLSCDATVVMGKQADCLVPMLSYFPTKMGKDQEKEKKIEEGMNGSRKGKNRSMVAVDMKVINQCNETH